MATTDLPVAGATITLSNSYQDATGWCAVGNSGWASFLLAWTKGDETSVEAVIDIKAGGATSRLPVESVAATGIITSKPASWSFTAADWPSLNPALSAKVLVQQCRLLVKKTGGAAPGTIVATQQEASNA